jgi:hypothetical protein
LSNRIEWIGLGGKEVGVSWGSRSNWGGSHDVLLVVVLVVL